MATQWTAGLTDNTTLPAATLNRIGATWETWTPNFRAESGAWTSSTTTAARYGRIGKLLYGQAGITINSVGTGTGLVTFDLPLLAVQGNPFGIGSGREANLTGNAFQVISATVGIGQIRFYNNGITANGNYNYSFNFFYEVA
jgi:hypothetical protein